VYEISVVSYQGSPASTAISAVFGADGGTIGRGANNTLVLPDPNRFVSRVQARVSFDGFGIRIANASTANPLLINDHELDSGEEGVLRDGDELRIGLYILKVRKVDAVETAVPSPKVPPARVGTSSLLTSTASNSGAANVEVAGDAPLALSPAASASIGAVITPSTQRPVSNGGTLASSARPDAASARPVAPSSATPATSVGNSAPSPRRAPDTTPPAAWQASAKIGTSSLGPVDPLQLEFGHSGDDPFADLVQSATAPPARTASDPLSHTAASTPQTSANALGGEGIPLVASRQPVEPRAHEPQIVERVLSLPGQVVPDHIWDDLARLAPSSPAPQSSSTTPLPVNFDAFAQRSDGARNADDPLAEFAKSGVALESFDKLDGPIDTLFTESPSAAKARDDIIPDPNAQVPDPLADRDSLDPMAIFDRGSAGSDPLDDSFKRSERDDVAELQAYFRPPQATPLGAAQASRVDTNDLYTENVREQPSPALDVARDPLAILGNERDDKNVAEHPTDKLCDKVAAADQVDVPRNPSIGQLRDAQATGARPIAPDELLREFLSGAGIPRATMQESLTPELMRRIGKMLSIAVQGTIELIAARALVKREVKADVTIIASTRNNPLKFLPDAESAMLQMFGTRIPGFMEPVEAMEDAYRDLRAHEVGVIAGMHAALAEVLRRFEPGELERRLKPPGVLEGLLPNSRQARLWETFAEMYVDISREAQDDFQSLFGKAFLQAYENEVSRLKGQ
jgi:FHA domain-containing protein